MEPEFEIFNRKRALSERLLEISPEELANAPEQSWYEEYIGLLAIRLENRTLKILGKSYVAELMSWYNQNVKKNKRELAILGVLQFAEPTELKVPFNQHLWHKTMIDDVRAIFTNEFPSVEYYDDAVSDYWLSKLSARKSERRKIRVVFVVRSDITCDKFLPVYEAMKARDDFEVYIVIHPDFDYSHSDTAWKYFYERYPDDKIYDYSGLMDIRKLKPDYVFFNHPYVRHRPFPSLRTNDILQFAKICIISYGASLIYAFPERLFEEYRHIYKNVYMLFASCESVKKIARKKLPQEYNHTEFLGYPVLKNYYKLPKTKSEVTRILWTPRWLVDDRWGGSHFMEYKDDFNNLRGRYGNKVELYLRPHMNLFTELIKKEVMTREETIKYKKKLKASGIIRQKRLADMDKSIANIDIFITDISSIIICLFLTCRPIIYCEFANGVPMPEYAEMFSAMYIAHSWGDVEKYLDELVAGNDPLLERRQEIAAKIYETHKDAADKIINWLIEDFNGGVFNE
ncbi:MAG: hypothetical protein IKT98_04035 [Selenomonadaceae bacterium]|nr:hypothetical protein [Selenomonadaceae bacterium]